MMMISAIRSFPSCRPVLQRVRCGVPALSTVRIGSIIPIMESGDRRFNSTSTTTPLKGQFHTTPANDSDFSTDPGLDTKPTSVNLPKRLRHKVLSAEDAVSLVRDGDTVCATGFVCQGTAEAVLRALGKRYEETGSPNNLTLFFGGGPGDWGSKGLSHLAKTKEGFPNMLRRTIGSHYGQVPGCAKMALSEQVEAWTLPMGSVSRMIRAQSTHSPGHITTVGIGTYMDPDIAGGAANESAKKSEFHPKLISKITIDGDTHLMYRAIPIKVAIIRGTTADVQGNITMEHESLLVDQRITATAAKNSGGIVIAQVKRIAANGSFHPRDVVVPGSLVDAIVVVDPEDHNEMHPMSYMQLYNPAYTGEVRTPVDEVAPLELDERKVIARRAFFFLQPDKIVNLGIGLPEGVASVAAEEGMLEYVTLTTEPGVFGGLPAGGHNFGPSINPGAHVEMNQMFDFYDGGGLDICFLGAAQIGKNGDVNVSRMSKERLTGPGGFIDISQSTKNICFLSPLTTKGLELSFPGDGTLKIEEEGKVKKFVDKVFEITFSGEEAVRRGQTVHYITDRAVFRKTAQHDVLELVEIAPGIDLQKDVLDQLEFTPIVSDELKLMDSRIFKDQVMETVTEMFGSLKERCHYNEAEHKLFLDLFGVNLNSESDVKWFYSTLHSILDPILMKKGKFDTVINYNGFNLRKGLDDMYAENAQKTQDRFFKTVKRFTGKAFYHARMGQALKMNNLDPNELFDECDTSKTGSLTVEQVRKFVQEKFQMNLSARQLQKFQRSEAGRVTREDFVAGLDEFIG